MNHPRRRPLPRSLSSRLEQHAENARGPSSFHDSQLERLRLGNESARRSPGAEAGRTAVAQRRARARRSSLLRRTARFIEPAVAAIILASFVVMFGPKPARAV